MPGISGDEEEHPASSNAAYISQLTSLPSVSSPESILTKQYDGNRNQDHQDMMVSQEGYQPLDADCKAYIRHGRKGLPAVWSMSVWGELQRPDGRELGGLWNAAGKRMLEQCYCLLVGMVFSKNGRRVWGGMRACDIKEWKVRAGRMRFRCLRRSCLGQKAMHCLDGGGGEGGGEEECLALRELNWIPSNGVRRHQQQSF